MGNTATETRFIVLYAYTFINTEHININF